MNEKRRPAAATNDTTNRRHFSHDGAVGELFPRMLAQFQQVTGLAAVLVPATFPNRPVWFGQFEDEFCRRAGAVCGGRCPVCLPAQQELFHRLSHKLRPQSVSCAAGLVQFAVPVVVRGKHVATVQGGKVRVQRGSERGFKAMIRCLGVVSTPGVRRRLRAAYFHPPSLTLHSFRHLVGLLDLMVRVFGEALARYPALSAESESPQVSRAKAYVQEHLGERLTTRHVAGVLRLNDCYFCRLFRRATGMTFRAYVAQVRVEAAKARLRDTLSSITEICYVSGFQSVSDFNRVFKACVGTSPSRFRRGISRWLRRPKL